MYELNDDTEAIEFSHNPFSMPQGGLEALESKKPLDILAYQYDIVCNGVELSSGAIRNHRADIMVKAFEIAGSMAKDLGVDLLVIGSVYLVGDLLNYVVERDGLDLWEVLTAH